MHFTQTSYVRSFALLGALTALTPFLHFPRAWNDVLLVIIGLLVIFLSYTLRAQKMSDSSKLPQPPLDGGTQNLNN
ncbi:MAG: hypothetical protein PHS53_00060 [Candidatus Pacebacteria bacterium]|nr:hypothetical protein [Candidatus Paceibacterota bacterium]MDD5356529.1 hypothetical protein [Candidatus Paceibacterota bacterium]